LKILGIDTTGQALSAAVCEDGRLLCELFLDTDSKHAQTLVPAIDCVLRQVGVTAQDIDVFACAAGPGSFTGVRIGVATIAAMACAAGKPAAAVSSLEALATGAEEAGAVCAMMDARRQEVYAMARCGQEILVPAQALPLAGLLDMLPDEPVVFTGDAAVTYRAYLRENREESRFLPAGMSALRASFVCAEAYQMARAGRLVRYDELEPTYLRLSQAERLRLEKEKGR